MDPLVIAQIVLAAVQDILFAAAAGALACGVMGRRSGWLGEGKLRAWCTVSSAVLACSALAYLWLQAAVMSGSPLVQAGSAITAVLTESHFGKAWSVGFAGALLAALSGLRRERGGALFAVGLLLWVAGKAAASHAADSGDFSPREAIHVVHLFATALWAGSVIVAAGLLGGLVRPANDSPRRRAAFCSALSHLATAALVVVLLTGFYNVLQDTAHANASLLHMGWGRVLVAKLTCVCWLSHWAAGTAWWCCPDCARAPGRMIPPIRLSSAALTGRSPSKPSSCSRCSRLPRCWAIRRRRQASVYRPRTFAARAAVRLRVRHRDNRTLRNTGSLAPKRRERSSIAL